MKNQTHNHNNSAVIEHDWNHHCLNLECNHTWDSNDLHEDCPNCGSSEHETICHIPELEGWDCVYPGDWQNALDI